MTLKSFIETLFIFTSLAAGVLGSPRCDPSWKSCPDDLLPVVLLLQKNKAYCKYTDCSSDPCRSDEDCVETIKGFQCLARANPTTTVIVPTTTMTTTTTPTMKDTTTALTTKDKQDSGVNQPPNDLPLSPVLLVTDNITNIHALSLSSPQASEDLNTNSVGTRGVAYDPIEGKIFYGSSGDLDVGITATGGVTNDPTEGKILWRTLNGSQTGTVPNLTKCSNVTSLAIDEEGRRLFAACRASYISSVNLNGSQPYRIYLRNVYNVIVAEDAVITTNGARKLLLASTRDGHIYRMELNGTDKQLVHAVNGEHLTITWDKECRHIFYAYRDAEYTIQVVDITGENHRILITHARLQIEGLAYYDGYVYWTNTNVRDQGTGIGKISAEANNTRYFEFYTQSWSGYEIIARGDLEMREFE